MPKYHEECVDLIQMMGGKNPHLMDLRDELPRCRGELLDWDDGVPVHWLPHVKLLAPCIGGLIHKYRLESESFQTQNKLAKMLFHEGRRDPPGWHQRGIQASHIAQFERGDLKHPLGPISFLQLSSLLDGHPLADLGSLCEALFGADPQSLNPAHLHCLEIAMQVVVEAGNRLEETDAQERTRMGTDAQITDMLRREIPEATIVDSRTMPGDVSGSIVWMANIDGVRNYRRGRLHWVTGVAAFYCDDNRVEPICAAVYNPPTQELFVAFEQNGAILIDKKRNLPRRLPGFSRSGRPDVAMHISTHAPSASCSIVSELETLAMECERIEMMSCGLLALCHVADGRIDAFTNAVTENRPDSVLAGKIILQAMGGRVEDYGGNEWHIGSSEVVASSKESPAAHALLLERLGISQEAVVAPRQHAHGDALPSRPHYLQRQHESAKTDHAGACRATRRSVDSADDTKAAR